jgi:hypothetical protein
MDRECAGAREDSIMTKPNETSSARQRLAGCVVPGFVAAAAFASAALAEPNNAVPQLASADFGWQSNVADWRDPPPGHGHGPIKPDPAHPFTSNAEAARTGTQPTKRIGDTKDPILKPWAAAQMQASNDDALRSEMAIPFAAQARCYPGGVPIRWSSIRSASPPRTATSTIFAHLTPRNCTSWSASPSIRTAKI